MSKTKRVVRRFNFSYGHNKLTRETRLRERKKQKNAAIDFDISTNTESVPVLGFNDTFNTIRLYKHQGCVTDSCPVRESQD